MALKHSVYDTDTHFFINPTTRAFYNESPSKNTIIQYDHNSERITFEIPRQIEGHDISLCDVIQVHYNNIDAITKEQNCGVYAVEDMQISPDDENIVILSWLVSGNATKYVGSLNFLIRFACTNDDGKVIYVWNTAIYSGISISSGIYNGDVVAEEYADILAQWKKEIDYASSAADVALKEVEAMKPKYTKDDIDPIFANNSWEKIKWVCQHDDPSKYWKVGDYKEVLYITDKKGKPFEKGLTNHCNFTIETKVFSEQDFFVENQSGEYGLTVDTFEHRKEDDPTMKTTKFRYKILYRAEVGGGWEIVKDTTKTDGVSADDYEKQLKEIGIILTVNREYYADKPIGGGFGGGAQTAQFVCKSYPLQIIGFNHDKVTDPYSYGKQKAGMTLQLGASRNVYGDAKPGLYEGTIEGLMAADGIRFKAPNSVRADYSTGATNWADGGFRVALQTLFDGTEIAPYLAEVKKQTSHHYQDGQKWAALMDTHDKVFLPSEYEYFGEVLYAPAREGEQYELYRDGTSKFMWATELLDGSTANARIAFRSTVGSKVSANIDYGGNCGMYLTVKSLSPVSVSYAHSYGSAECWIAPCICL